jgi:hypothetical protein
LLVRVFAGICWFLCVAYCFSLLKTDLASQSFYAVAQSIEADRPVDNADIVLLSTGPALELANTSCRTSLLKAALSIQLAAVDRIDEVGDFARWAEAVQRSRGFLLHAISCAPTIGNFWLRLAMLSRATAEDPSALARQLNISRCLSPSERSAVVARLQVFGSVSPATRELAKSAVEADLLTLRAYGDATDRQLVASQIGTTLDSYLKTARTGDAIPDYLSTLQHLICDSVLPSTQQ